MRRLQQNETLHGTRHGQLVVDAELGRQYGLTDRESAAAALLARGNTRAEIAEYLGISSSTAEKHLASLRKKLGARSTTEAAATLASFSVVQVAGAPRLGTNPHHEGRTFSESERALVERFGSAADVDAAVMAFRSHFTSAGVEAVSYGFVPQNAVSFRRGQAITGFAGSARLMEALHASGGVLTNPIALRIFSEPDREVVVDAQGMCRNGPPLVPEIPRGLVKACQDGGISLSVSFGTPFGCGFAGVSIFFGGCDADASDEGMAELVLVLRSALMSLQSSLFARGVLARTVDLTVRERDALSLISQGLTLEVVAEHLGGSPRSCSQLLRSARKKLDAVNNTEAVAKAMALNALVFL